MDSRQLDPPTPDDLREVNLIDIAMCLKKAWRLVIGGSLLVGLVALAASFLVPPTFTARTTLLPPQAERGMGLGAALSSLGPLAGIAAGGAAGRSGEFYVALLRSNMLGERLIQRHKLKELYNERFHFEVLDTLHTRTRIELNKKNGIIKIEFDDADPARAALIANDYVRELQSLSGSMALSEAQRKRKFFETELGVSRKALANAQDAVQAAGFDQGALRAEPRAVIEEYARIKGTLTSNEVKLIELNSRLASGTPEVVSLQATVAALRAQLRVLEKANQPIQSQDYISRYREFKYQESLYEQLFKQFEAARLEESREDSSIQVIDVAKTPEWKSKPKRGLVAVAAALIAAFLLSAAVIIQQQRLKAGRPVAAGPP
jgi:uncharacterized protein involved in exopolysaccharide biosynthesis